MSYCVRAPSYAAVKMSRLDETMSEDILHPQQRKISSTLTNFTFPLSLGFLILMASTGLALDVEARVENSGVYSKAAVATDAGVCSEIGVDILKKGGGAVDAAISSLLCTGVVNLHSTGIGGGGFMLFYEAAKEEVHALDYREVAPNAASCNMYEGLEPTASTVGE